MKIGIYGGSFNPVHFGHIGLATWLLQHTDLQEVWMMVSPNNPLKDATVLADGQERLARVREAAARAEAEGAFPDGKRLRVSDLEFGLSRPNYTVDTLRALQRLYPTDEFVLLMGEDNWRTIDRWREWEYILRHFRVMVYPRHGAKDDVPSAVNHRDARWLGVTKVSDAPYFDISSTELRNRFQNS